MSFFIKEFARKKIRSISADELLAFARQYEFQVKRTEAEQIVHYLRNTSQDPFVAADRKKIFRELAQITDPKTAKQAEKLFYQLIKSYGVEHLFEY